MKKTHKKHIKTTKKAHQKKHKRKILIATIAWGALMIILGVLFYQFAVMPLAYQASGVEGASKCKTVFCGDSMEEGVKVVEQGLKGSSVSTEENVLIVILGWINFSLPFAGLFAFAGIVYAGFLYVANFGDDEMTGKAKNIIFYAIAGLVLIFSAYAIIATVIRASTA